MAGTEVYGPYDTAPMSDQTMWYRWAPSWAPSGVIDVPAASASVGGLGLTFSGLTPTLSAGRAWVRGAGYELSGGSKTLPAITANTNASLSRMDRIVLRRDLSAKTVGPVALTGTPAGSPSAPALTQVEAGQWDIPLFSFLVPPNSGTTITGITDERVFIDPDGGSKRQPRVWAFPRTSGNSSDNFAASGMVNLISGSIPNAPAGDYLVTTRWTISNTAAGAGFMRTTANGNPVAAGSNDARADFQANRNQVSQVGYVSGFAGGTMTLVGSLQSSTGGTPTVWTDGSEIVVAYLGAH